MLQELWQRTQTAYAHNDVKELSEIEVLVRKALREMGAGKIRVESPDIDKKIDELKKEIREIKETEPYTYKSLMEDPSVLQQIRVDDKLILQREDNKFDSRAILVLTEAKQKLGYIPEKDNLIFSRLMDAGKLLAAKIRKIQQKGSFTQIGIGIYLVDF